MNDLPKSISDIASIVGRRKALLIAGYYSSTRCQNNRDTRGDNTGGDCVYIPSKMTKDHKLSQLIGFNSAKELSKHTGGILLNISGCRRIYLDFRNSTIAEMKRQGLKICEIAELMDLTNRHVHNIIQAQEARG